MRKDKSKTDAVTMAALFVAGCSAVVVATGVWFACSPQMSAEELYNSKVETGGITYSQRQNLDRLIAESDREVKRKSDLKAFCISSPVYCDKEHVGWRNL